MTQATNMEKSAEYLRLALPFMTRYRIPVTPQNYAVWYTYVSGQNAGLTRAIDEIVSQQRDLDEAVTQTLHRQFLDPPDGSKLEKARTTVQALVEEVSRSLSVAHGEVDRYESSLRDCSARIAKNDDLEQVRGIVADLVSSTRQMNDGTSELRDRLDESRNEAARLREELAQARAEASMDVLTGLANRKALAAAWDELGAASESTRGNCLLIADIDHFKSINDSYGHLLGDKVIKAVAQSMRKLIKGKDLAARIGGEEFVVLLPDTPREGALTVAQSIRRAVETARIVKPSTNEEIRRVTISIGVTEIASGETLEIGLARADQALYRAKEGGRNRVEFVQAQLSQAAAA